MFFDVDNPYTKKTIKKLKFHSEEEILLKIEKFKDFKLEDNHKVKISKILKAIILDIKDHKNTWAVLISSEGGKPYKDAVIEVERALQSIEIAISELYNFAGNEIPMGLSESSVNNIAFESYVPYGPVLAISAFNHPLNLIVHQLVPALIVGCPVLLKPSLDTPLTAINFVDLLHNKGISKELCDLVLCNNDSTEALAKNSFFKVINFIGSSKVGWYLRSVISPGTRICLEHGGVAPVVISKNSNYKKYLENIAKAAFYHAGQVCISTQKIYVYEGLYDEFCGELISFTKKLRVGDPLDKTIEVGPIIGDNQYKKILKLIRESGGNILCGGQGIDSHNIIEPTIISDVPIDNVMNQEEIFGPVVLVEKYKELDEVIRKINNCKYAFQASMFSNDYNEIMQFNKNIEAKAVLVNNPTTYRVDWMPFGGVKESGLGNGGIKYTMQEYCYKKMMVFRCF